MLLPERTRDSGVSERRAFFRERERERESDKRAAPKSGLAEERDGKKKGIIKAGWWKEKKKKT